MFKDSQEVTSWKPEIGDFLWSAEYGLLKVFGYGNGVIQGKNIKGYDKIDDLENCEPFIGTPPTLYEELK